MKNGWQQKQIGDLCEVIAGQSPEGKFYNAEGKGMPFYQGKKDFGEKFIETPTTWTTQTTKIAQEGDILMSVRAPVGPVNFATEEVCIGRGLAAIRSGTELNRDFLFYQLQHLQPEIAGREGAVFASINKSEIEGLPLAFVPLPEQQRIVGTLDEAFAGVATAKANAEKNLQNARALFESHLQSVLTRRGKGWAEKPLASLCSLFVDSAHRTPKYQADGIPALRPRDVVNGKLTLTEAARVSQKEYEIQSRRHRPAPGDIVYSRELSYGWAVILPESPCICLSQGMCLFRPTPSLDSAFLLHVLNGPVGREQALRAAVGAAHPHINLGDIKAYQIPFPSPGEQKLIARKLDAMLAETQHLESIYQQKLAALGALTKSLLHQAFAGQL
jgi:type I restriction enzyme S subunit